MKRLSCITGCLVLLLTGVVRAEPDSKSPDIRLQAKAATVRLEKVLIDEHDRHYLLTIVADGVSFEIRNIPMSLGREPMSPGGNRETRGSSIHVSEVKVNGLTWTRTNLSGEDRAPCSVKLTFPGYSQIQITANTIVFDVAKEQAPGFGPNK